MRSVCCHTCKRGSNFQGQFISKTRGKKTLLRLVKLAGILTPKPNKRQIKNRAISRVEKNPQAKPGSSLKYFFSDYFTCMYKCLACMNLTTCMPSALEVRQKRAVRVPQIEATGGCELLRGFWEPGSSQRQTSILN